MAAAPKLKLITSEVDPDLAEVKRFIKAKIAEGAVAALIAAVLALLARMRDLNTELHKRIEAARRGRPPSETLNRLQMELPLWGTSPDNDVAEHNTETPKKERKKRGPKAAGPARSPEAACASAARAGRAPGSRVAATLCQALARARCQQPADRPLPLAGRAPRP